jgi:predicted PolB exonuclease-like 3'-5' exonuclease
MDAIETAFTAALGMGYFDQYIKDQHGKPGKKIDGKETTRDYWYRYGRDHIDICDAISGFGASARPSLAELAALCGIPAKIDGLEGSQVESMVATGRLEELAGYCDTDIFVTYLLFLRFSLVTGGINLDYYVSSLEHLHQHIADRIQKRPHLQEYLRVLEPMIGAAAQLKPTPRDQT